PSAHELRRRTYRLRLELCRSTDTMTLSTVGAAAAPMIHDIWRHIDTFITISIGWSHDPLSCIEKICIGSASFCKCFDCNPLRSRSNTDLIRSICFAADHCASDMCAMTDVIIRFTLICGCIIPVKVMIDVIG